jgi:hypothetical protein
LPANQIGRQLGQEFEAAFGPAVLDCDVPAFGVADILQALMERGELGPKCVRRRRVQKPNDRRLLLRARRERPRGRGAEKRDERAAFHA